MENDLVFCKCQSCGTYSFYKLTECVDSCKSCGNAVDLIGGQLERITNE